MRRLSAGLCALLLCAACSEPPQKEIDQAQGAIDAARAAGAPQYAASEFDAATTALQQAHDAVEQRDYRLALSLAIDASERAQSAARQAADGKARARSQAESAVATTTTSLQQLRTAVKSAQAAKVPAKELASARRLATSVEGALQKARALLTAEQYLEASALLKDVPAQIGERIGALNEAARPRPVRRRTNR